MRPRSRFDDELEDLNIKLIEMGALAQEAISDSVKALLTNRPELAKSVIANDRNIDELEKVIEQKCLKLLMLQQPVARDLRVISTALKMITDLERIGDQAADIADLTLRFNDQEQLSFAKNISPMADIAKSMVKSCIEAYIKNDLDLATNTIKRDDEVDDLFDVVKEELIQTVTKDKDKADQAIDLMMIAKYLERIGDHAVNVCEWVIFYSTGLHKKTQIL
ncbi:MAG: phosphate signaling complex protein PhoU [Oscillospiraceae bacterium]|nr:phosphate signaling complex protein PhoU [Oscillospiraceae bacterium]